MRATARLLVVLSIASSLGGCAAGAPKCEKISYNRRELPPGPGVLTGPTGSYTVYSRGKQAPQECHPSAHGRGGGEIPEAEGGSPAPDG